MMDRETFAPDLEPLLSPIPGPAPAGPMLRYDPAWLALRSSREEDDPSLPMREWERPLKKADWRAVTHGCETLLRKTKDLQLAAWLCDAWVRQHQVAGLVAATDLMAALIDRYWDTLHPAIEDGDSEARTAPFVWLNETLPMTLRLHVPLMPLPDQQPPTLTLAAWEQVVAPRSRPQDDEQVLTRDELVAWVDGPTLAWLSSLQQQVEVALPKWEALARDLDERLALDAPSLGKVTDALRRLQRACIALLDGRDPRAKPVPEPEPSPSIFTAPPASLPEVPTMSAVPAESPSAMPVAPGAIASRQDAYRMLEAAAAYLERTEPHSPTPYLVKRAVSWGQMSLADLMQEVLREEGDLGRFFSMIGINLPRN